MMTQAGDSPQIQVDSDWKAQAQAEKAKLAAKDEERKATTSAAKTDNAANADAPQAQQVPPADFKSLVSSIASQALFSMGAMPDPQTGQRYVHLDLARHHIDSLNILCDKTQGNLDDEEARLLNGTLYELRSSYVQVSSAQRSPATGGQGGAV